MNYNAKDAVKLICNTVSGCTFVVCVAWVITAIWGH